MYKALVNIVCVIHVVAKQQHILFPVNHSLNGIIRLVHTPHSQRFQQFLVYAL